MNDPRTPPVVVGMAFVRSPAGIEPFNSDIIAGMEDVLHAHGMQVLMQTVASADEMPAVYRRWAESQDVAGIVVSDLTDDDPRISLLRTLRIPHVTLGEPTEDSAAGRDALGAVVRADNYAATVDAVHRLAALGHRVISRVTGPQRFVHIATRTQAFSDALSEIGATGRVIEGDYSADSGIRGLAELLSDETAPTAVIFDNDLMALAGLAEAQRRGLVVPDDLSILAWDDSIPCRLSDPPLSAMSHDVRELGHLIAHTLLAVIAGQPPEDLTAPDPVFVERGSTARPSHAAAASTTPSARGSSLRDTTIARKER